MRTSKNIQNKIEQFKKKVYERRAERSSARNEI